MGREGMQGEGGSFSDFTLTVDKAYFATDPRYRGGEILFLHLLGRTDNEAMPVFSEDGFHPSWSCGKGWVSNDGGQTATSETGKKGFHPSSAIQEALVDPAMAVTGSLEGTGQDPFEGADAKKASIWVGTQWRFTEKVKTFKIKDSDTGEMVERSRTNFVPVEYLGKANAGGTVTAPPAETPATPGNGLREQIVELARSSASFPDFLTAATRVPGVKEDAELFSAVADQSIWTEVHPAG